MPILVAARSKAWVCGNSLAGIAGSNPADSIEYLSPVIVVCFQIKSLRRAETSSRGVLLNVCVTVCDQA
jgi:hypothetical protein